MIFGGLKRKICFLTFAIALAVPATAQIVILTNLNPEATPELYTGWNNIEDQRPASNFAQFFAISFTLGEVPFAITDVDLLLNDFDAGDVPLVSLHADSGFNRPGAMIGSPLQNPPAGNGIKTFSAVTPITLAANTKYWLKMEIAQVSTQMIGWAWTNQGVVVPSGIVTFGEYRVGNGTNYNVLYSISGSKPEFAIRALAVPEPSTVAGLMLGLGVLAIRHYRARRPR